MDGTPTVDSGAMTRGRESTPPAAPARRFHVETLGCPKNAVDSDKVVASLLTDGLLPAKDAASADLVVVNTCAFIESARQESIDTVLALSDQRREGAHLVVTGCMAERYGAELAAALPEVDAVIGFASEGGIAPRLGIAPAVSDEMPAGGDESAVRFRPRPRGVRDLLELPRARPDRPWSYLKVAEGCDRSCAFCAIPSFRGKQRSRPPASIVHEARELVGGGVAELVLVAQDLAWYGRDAGERDALVRLLRDLDALRSDGLARIRLLYLYPSEVRDPLVDTMLELESVVPYFDLSLQHAAPGLLRRMKRWGSGERFLSIIDLIRSQCAGATFRSSFISGFPGETEADHDELVTFLDAAQLDWAGFFAFSREDGTVAADLDGVVDEAIVRERLRDLAETQEPITNAARAALIGARIDVLIDSVTEAPGDEVASPATTGAPHRRFVQGRSAREAPEIDGMIRWHDDRARPGEIVAVAVVDVEGPDLDAVPIAVLRR